MTKANAHPSAIGKGMLWIFWLLVLIALTYASNQWLGWRHNPNSSPKSFSDGGQRIVVLQSNDRNHYVTNGKVNNAPVTFMLDTGATHVAIPESLAQKLKLSRGFESFALTANGPIKVHATQLDTLQIGDIILHDVQASIFPGFDNQEILLGMSALKQLEFTQKGDTLTLKQYF